ncbi:unnamed protein product [Pleuronectes platessa]|uniref:Uncharacterized protein n=1 Tax=Pleuronectes platessa TaxID=8262 RepID=A0A9N7UD65_PLEPL|nr:unnamed protein product [Pleuronectes platessa]
MPVSLRSHQCNVHPSSSNKHPQSQWPRPSPCHANLLGGQTHSRFLHDLIELSREKVTNPLTAEFPSRFLSVAEASSLRVGRICRIHLQHLFGAATFVAHHHHHHRHHHLHHRRHQLKGEHLTIPPSAATVPFSAAAALDAGLERRGIILVLLSICRPVHSGHEHFFSLRDVLQRVEVCALSGENINTLSAE